MVGQAGAIGENQQAIKMTTCEERCETMSHLMKPGGQNRKWIEQVVAKRHLPYQNGEQGRQDQPDQPHALGWRLLGWLLRCGQRVHRIALVAPGVTHAV